MAVYFGLFPLRNGVRVCSFESYTNKILVQRATEVKRRYLDTTRYRSLSDLGADTRSANSWTGSKKVAKLYTKPQDEKMACVRVLIRRDMSCLERRSKFQTCFWRGMTVAGAVGLNDISSRSTGENSRSQIFYIRSIVNHEAREEYRDETMAKGLENEPIGELQSTRLEQTTRSH